MSWHRRIFAPTSGAGALGWTREAWLVYIGSRHANRREAVECGGVVWRCVGGKERTRRNVGRKQIGEKLNAKSNKSV